MSHQQRGQHFDDFVHCCFVTHLPALFLKYPSMHSQYAGTISIYCAQKPPSSYADSQVLLSHPVISHLTNSSSPQHKPFPSHSGSSTGAGFGAVAAPAITI